MLAVLGVLVILAPVAVALGFRGAALTRPPKTNLSALRHGYRTIFTNPNARICYAAVFIEGCCVLGLFPFVAAFLFELGETSLSIAGIVIAGFAVGGLFYTMSVSRFLPRLGVKGMMIGGAALVGLQLAVVAFGPGWKVQALSLLFMGWGFYMIHGSPAGVCQRAFGGSPRHRAVAALVLLFHGTDRRSDRVWIRHREFRQGSDLADYARS